MVNLAVLSSDHAAEDILKGIFGDNGCTLHKVETLDDNTINSVFAVSEDKFKDVEKYLNDLKAVVVLAEDDALAQKHDTFDICTLKLNDSKEFITTKLKFVSRIAELKNDLEKLSTTDPLTGIYNRKYLHQRLSEEMSRAKRYGTPLSVILFDIDYFKAINDIYGYQFGDEVLIQLAGIMAKFVRMEDIVTRYGDEEFVIALPNTDSESAFKLADRIRESISKMDFNKDVNDPDPLHIRLSGGLFTYTGETSEDSVNDIVRYAEHALYNAKKTGKNKIIDFNRLEFKI